MGIPLFRAGVRGRSRSLGMPAARFTTGGREAKRSRDRRSSTIRVRCLEGPAAGRSRISGRADLRAWKGPARYRAGGPGHAQVGRVQMAEAAFLGTREVVTDTGVGAVGKGALYPRRSVDAAARVGGDSYLDVGGFPVLGAVYWFGRAPAVGRAGPFQARLPAWPCGLPPSGRHLPGTSRRLARTVFQSLNAFSSSITISPCPPRRASMMGVFPQRSMGARLMPWSIR